MKLYQKWINDQMSKRMKMLSDIFNQIYCVYNISSSNERAIIQHVVIEKIDNDNDPTFMEIFCRFQMMMNVSKILYNLKSKNVINEYKEKTYDTHFKLSENSENIINRYLFFDNFNI